MLFYTEVAPTLDPIRSTASGGSDAQPMFALYGALVTLDPYTLEMEPLLAESLEPNDDFTVWTLTLRDGIVFSDGSPYDAAAVMDYWTRIGDPANASPAVSTAGTIASMEVVDPLTLEVTLVGPDAHFDKSIERHAFNWVPSSEAVAAGHDFTNDPVGAGPFLLEEWVRDDHMSLVPNPDWIGSDGPYLDRYTFAPPVERAAAQRHVRPGRGPDQLHQPRCVSRSRPASRPGPRGTSSRTWAHRPSRSTRSSRRSTTPGCDGPSSRRSTMTCWSTSPGHRGPGPPGPTRARRGTSPRSSSRPTIRRRPGAVRRGRGRARGPGRDRDRRVPADRRPGPGRVRPDVAQPARQCGAHHQRPADRRGPPAGPLSGSTRCRRGATRSSSRRRN